MSRMLRSSLQVFALVMLIVYSRAEDSPPKRHQIPPDIATADHYDGHYVPMDLEDCFTELQRLLKPDDLKELKEGTEDNLALYHLGLGMGLRNQWGLWAGSRLAKYFNTMGIFHPDDMSGIILTSFWRRLNDKPIDFDKQIAHYQDFWKKARTMEKEAAERRPVAKARVEAKISGMMMGLKLEERKASSVMMPPRVNGEELRVRFLAPFRDGVFLAARGPIEGNQFDLSAYYLDLAEGKIHPITVPEIAGMHSAVAIGDRAWFLGRKAGQTVLLETSREKRQVVPLPEQPTGFPQLGLDGDHVLLVYQHEVFRRDGELWVPLYEGQSDLPRSGPPPALLDGRLFFRDEGSGEDNKRLHWLTFAPPAKLKALDEDMDLKELYCDPAWGNCFGYCVTSEGELWATIGEGDVSQSLARRTASGEYRIAIVNGELQFRGLEASGDRSKMLHLSTLSVGSDALLLAGRSGLYELRGQLLTPRVRFTNTEQEIPIEDGKHIYHWAWDPSHMLALGKDRYLISGDFGGVYLLECADQRPAKLLPLDQDLREPVSF